MAILETIERMKVGNPNFSNRLPGSKTAAKSVGFGSKATANNARRVVREGGGVPELVDAMDQGAIAIRPAAGIARLPQTEQRGAATRGAPRAGQPSGSWRVT